MHTYGDDDKPSFWNSGRFWLFASAVIVLVVLVCAFSCSPLPKPPVPTDNFVPHSPFFPFGGGWVRTITEAPDTSVLGWIAAMCFLIGFGALIASFVPALSLFIPRTAAIGAIVSGVAALCLKYFLAKYLGILMLVTILAGACVGAIFLVVWIKARLRAAAVDRAAKNDPEAAAALTIAADPRKWLPVKKSLLAHITATGTIPQSPKSVTIQPKEDVP